MRQFRALVQRNCKLFFKDKGMFFTSLITPLILLVLYVTFLEKVYRDSFVSSLPYGFTVEEALLNGTVGCQLLSSLLAVCCITVSFCSNLLMVQDKITGAAKDLSMAPVKPSVLALGYFTASAASTLLICYVALFAGLLYLAALGWTLAFSDILMLLLDVLLLVLFGTSLSSLINCNLSTNGQASAVGTIVSAGYGFVCGAYMPISNFSDGLQTAMSFLPGTYGTALLRNHALRGVYEGMSSAGIPPQVIEGIKDSIDCNLYFFEHKVGTDGMLLVLSASVLLLTAGYVLLQYLKQRKRYA